MVLHNDPMGYNNQLNSVAMQNFDVYSDRQEKLKIGRVMDVLLDQAGNLRYFIVELNSLMSGKQVLIPLQNAQIDLQTQRLYVQGLTKAEVGNLPPYQATVSATEGATESRPEVVREVPLMRSLEDSAPLEASAPLEGYPVEHYHTHTEVHRQPASSIPVSPPISQSAVSPPVSPVTMPPRTVSPPPSPSVASTPAAHLHTDRTTSPTPIPGETVIPLREERLIVDRKSHKVGEVVMRKEVETEIIEVPIQRERLIVEQVGDDPKILAEIDLDHPTHPNV